MSGHEKACADSLPTVRKKTTQPTVWKHRLAKTFAGVCRSLQTSQFDLCFAYGPPTERKRVQNRTGPLRKMYYNPVSEQVCFSSHIIHTPFPPLFLVTIYISGNSSDLSSAGVTFESSSQHRLLVFLVCFLVISHQLRVS